MKYCSKCGEQNPDEAQFCKSCGEPLTAKKSVSNQISAIWDLDDVDFDCIKVIFADGYNIEAEYEQPCEEGAYTFFSCLSVFFDKGKLQRINYDHSPNSGVSFTVVFRQKIIRHLFKPNEYTGKIIRSSVYWDNSYNEIDAEEWWEKYDKMFYEDVEPLRAKLTEFFGFDIIEDKYWEDR